MIAEQKNRFLVNVKAFTENDTLVKIIYHCALTTTDQTYNSYKRYLKKNAWRSWTDLAGNIIELKISPELTYKQAIYNKPSIVTDLYFFWPYQDILKITNRALIILGKNEEDKVISAAFYALCADNRLRLLLFNNFEYLGQFQPLSLGVNPLITFFEKENGIYDVSKKLNMPITGKFEKMVICNWTREKNLNDIFWTLLP